MLRRTVAPLFIGSLLLRLNSGANVIVLGLLLAQLSAHAGHPVTSLHVGLLPVVFYISELVLAPALGALSDRWGRRGFLIVGPLFGLLQVSLLVFTPTQNPLPYLLALQALAGLSGAMTTPAILGYLADLTVENRAYRMRVMSFFELATSGGIALGTVMGGFAWERFGRGAFLLLAASYLLVSICMVLSPVVSQIIERSEARVTLRRYWQLLRAPRLFVFIPAWICIMALVGVWLSSQLTFILTRPVHDPHQFLMGLFSSPQAGRHISLVLGAFVCFFGLSLLFWAYALNRVPRLRLMLTSIGGVYLSCVVLFCINHFAV
ncbi:MAG: MFS transporter, partial [Ktedonobacteraceae bacterium]|nr:MFS transporter [Ktedonobacteraceae bacterium]